MPFNFGHIRLSNIIKMEFTFLRAFSGETDEENKFCIHRAVLLEKVFSPNTSVDSNKSRMKRTRKNLLPLQRLKEKIPENDPETLAKYAKRNIKIFFKKSRYELVFETKTNFQSSLNLLCKKPNEPLNCHKLLFKLTSISNFQKSKMREVPLQQFFTENGIVWDTSFFDIARENELAALKPNFGLSFFVSEGKHIESRQIYRSMNETFKIIISKESAENSKISLEEKVFICKSYLQTFYCKASLGCGYSSRNKAQVTRHEKTCSSETKFKYVQKRYPQEDSTVEELKKLGININYHYLTWDIETLANGDNFSFGKSVCLGEHRVVSIGLFGQDLKKIFLGENCVSDFLRAIEEYQCEKFNNLPKNTKKYMETLAENLEKKDLAPHLKTRYSRHFQYLKNMTNLYLLGFNSSRFDLPAIISKIFDDIEPNEVKIIKNGNNFISLTFRNLTFLDVRLYISGGSLDKFGKTFQAKTQKLVFPYEHFQNIDQINATKKFPPIKYFKSSLNEFHLTKNDLHQIAKKFKTLEDFKQFFGCDSKNDFHVDPLIYFKCKKMFDEKISSGEWNSFADYLAFYNLSDCEVLYEGFQNYSSLFRKTFNFEVLSKITLPSISEGKT